MTENPEHGIVENEPGSIQVPCIAITDLDHVGVAEPVQLFLALAILSQATFDQYGSGIGQYWCVM